MRSPGQILQDSGGIEGLLQEAAKGVYKRSEQWGLSQALRTAVQGLHSGSNSPRHPPAARWSLDEGKMVKDYEGLPARIQALEDRNKALAKMLQDSIDDISAQAKEFETEKLEAKANKLTLSVAKLQFLQVHLENPVMPLGPEGVGLDGVGVHDRRDSHSEKDTDSSSITISPSDERIRPVASVAPTLSGPTVARRQNSQDSEPRSPTPTRVPARRPPNISAVPRITRAESPQQSPFQSSRPSLAQSSFSWMLGNEENGTNFVSAAPFSPERDRKVAGRGKAGFLFGDEKNENPPSKAGKDKGKQEKEDGDGFTLGTLKGIDKR